MTSISLFDYLYNNNFALPHSHPLIDQYTCPEVKGYGRWSKPLKDNSRYRLHVDRGKAEEVDDYVPKNIKDANIFSLASLRPNSFNVMWVFKYENKLQRILFPHLISIYFYSCSQIKRPTFCKILYF